MTGDLLHALVPPSKEREKLDSGRMTLGGLVLKTIINIKVIEKPVFGFFVGVPSTLTKGHTNKTYKLNIHSVELLQYSRFFCSFCAC